MAKKNNYKNCKVPCCDKPYISKGYCNTHYKRFKKYGNPLVTKQEKHGMRYTREYNIWDKMIQRCLNKNNSAYSNYGGRGIKVCDRWVNSFSNFYQDMGDSNGLTIDRIDNDGDYELSNCRWATYTTQARNRRKPKTNTSGLKGVTFNKKYKKWRTYISLNGGERIEKFFNTFEEAKNQRLEWEKKYWGEIN